MYNGGGSLEAAHHSSLARPATCRSLREGIDVEAKRGCQLFPSPPPARVRRLEPLQYSILSLSLTQLTTSKGRVKGWKRKLRERLPTVPITFIYIEILLELLQLFSKSFHTPPHYSYFTQPPRGGSAGMELKLEEGYPIHPPIHFPLLHPYSGRPIPSPRDGPKCSHKMYHEIPRWVIYPLPARACERATIAFQPSSPSACVVSAVMLKPP